MIKIYTTNQNGKIELTKQELMELIEEIKRECRKENPQPAIPQLAVSNRPNHTIQSILAAPCCADDAGYRKNEAANKSEVFLRLAKELNF